VLGANGSGKTTLLNIIAGTEFSSNGKVFINKTDVSHILSISAANGLTVFQIHLAELHLT